MNLSPANKGELVIGECACEQADVNQSERAGEAEGKGSERANELWRRSSVADAKKRRGSMEVGGREVEEEGQEVYILYREWEGERSGQGSPGGEKDMHVIGKWNRSKKENMERKCENEKDKREQFVWISRTF